MTRKKELALSDPSFIGDYLASKVSHKHKDLSSIELQDMYIPQRWIVSTQDFQKERNLENYTEFMEKCKFTFINVLYFHLFLDKKKRKEKITCLTFHSITRFLEIVQRSV